jgi:hypothetical protein
MIGYQFQLQNRAGQSLTINDHSGASFIALQDYPVFDVDIKNNEIDKEGQHGIWDFYSFYGKRVLTFSGVIVGTTEAEVETLKNLLIQVTALPPQPTTGNDGMVLVKWTDAAGNAWQIYAKLERAIRFDRQMKQALRLNFVMTLKAPNPVIESQGIVIDTGTRAWQPGSLQLPTTLPAIIAPVYENALVVSNSGAYETDTVIRLYGETGGITNPVLFNITTGKFFKVNITLASAAEWIEIDSKNGTVKDQDGADVSGSVDPASEYLLLASGNNQLVYLSDESINAQNPSNTWSFPQAQVTISHHTSIL